MQPYFFPYIGYFQLINAVDLFIVYDDVNYIKGGWINRNRILENGKAVYFTLQVIGASSHKLINLVKVGGNSSKLVKTLIQNYKKAPYFNDVMPMLEELLLNHRENLVDYLLICLNGVCDYLKIMTKIELSSSLEKNLLLKGEEKIIDICNRIGAKTYINALGGVSLYHKDNFEKNKIKLMFLKPILTPYSQFHYQFIPWLSIIDVLMFNSRQEISDMLKKFELIDGLC